MKKPTMMLTIAAVAYIAMIAFARLHPVGRDLDMLDFKTNRSTAVITSLCMLGSSASYLYATKEQKGGKTLRLGCLGVFLALAASMIAAFVDITPKSWTPLQSQRFTVNLVTVTTIPFIIICVLGLHRLRVEEVKPDRKSRW